MREHPKISNKQYLALKRTAQKAREQSRSDDLRSLMGQPWGRRLAWWMIYGDPSDEAKPQYMGLLLSTVFEPAIREGSSCNIRAALRDGARAYAVELNNAIERAAPELFALMMREQLDERTRALALDVEPRTHEDIDYDD